MSLGKTNEVTKEKPGSFFLSKDYYTPLVAPCALKIFNPTDDIAVYFCKSHQIQQILIRVEVDYNPIGLRFAKE